MQGGPAKKGDLCQNAVRRHPAWHHFLISNSHHCTFLVYYFVSAVSLMIMATNDKVIVAVITSQSGESLPHNFVNCSAEFCGLISLLSHRSVSQTNSPRLCFIVSVVPETTCPHQHSPLYFFNAFWSDKAFWPIHTNLWHGFFPAQLLKQRQNLIQNPTKILIPWVHNTQSEQSDDQTGCKRATSSNPLYLEVDLKLSPGGTCRSLQLWWVIILLFAFVFSSRWTWLTWESVYTLCDHVTAPV